MKRTVREGDSGVEEVRGLDFFVSCLCWNAGETQICVLVALPLLFTTAARGAAGYQGRKIGFAVFFKKTLHPNWKFVEIFIKLIYAKFIPQLSSHRHVSLIVV